MPDPDELRDWEIQAARGDTFAMSQLGAHYNRQGDVDTAHEWFFRAAEAGDPRAAAYLGWVFQRYGGIDDAIHWTRIAIERGDPDAPTQLEFLLNPPTHHPLDPTAQSILYNNRRDATAAIGAGDEDLAWRLLATGDEWGDADSIYMLGEWWERQGTLGHALIYFQRAISVSPVGHRRAETEIRRLMQAIRSRDENGMTGSST